MSDSDVDADPVGLLKEITQIALDRMNYGADVGSWEAMTLGKITGVAVRYPGVLEGLRDVPAGLQDVIVVGLGDELAAAVEAKAARLGVSGNEAIRMILGDALQSEMSTD